MLFVLSEEQKDFQDTVRSLLSRRMTPARLREIWNEGGTERSGLWQQLADIGVVGMVIPSDYEGAEATQVELALALEQAGYFGLTDPLLETAAVAAPLILEFGSEAQKAEWLPRIAAGAATLSLSIDGSGIAVWGAVVDAVIVLKGDELHLVPRGTLDWTLLSVQDPTRQSAIADFGSLGVDTLLTASPLAIGRAMDLARMATANVLVGLSQRLLDMARDYSLQREQFGQVIGSFQALKHRMADMAVAIEAARGLSWYAAYAAAYEPENASAAARTAKASAGAAGYLANSGSLQIHGGIGFTWEHDLHLWLKKGQALEAAYGNASDQRVALGRAIVREQQSA